MTAINQASQIALIINADDFGITDSVCRGIVDLFEANAAASTSLMIAASNAETLAKKWDIGRFTGRVGVHLQITAGVPLSPLNEVPSLVRADGRFRHKSEMESAAPDEVALEWSRQIERTAEILGTAPSHIDTHHGTHRLSKFTDIYIELAKRFSLPVRAGTEDVRAKIQAANVPTPSACLRDWTGRSLGVERLKQMLSSVSQSGGDNRVRSVEIVSHPGYCDEELMRTSMLNVRRETDLVSLMDLASSGWLSQQGFSLSSYADAMPHLSA